MSSEMLPGLRSLVHFWIVKKDPAQMPERLTDKDIEAIAKVSLDTLNQREAGQPESEWESLQKLTSGWIVQRERGQIPFPLTAEDFGKFLHLAEEGSQSLGHGSNSENIVPNEEAEVAEASQLPEIDPFRFAREHLARCL